MSTQEPFAVSAGPTAKDIARIIGATHEPTGEQQRIIESPTRPLLVVAGAGSGKTETMSQRVLWLVANQGIPASSILGLTFTRKAAGELGTRLRERLARLYEADGGDLGDTGGWDEPVASTYNSFAEGIVREHGLRIGLDPEVKLLGQAAAVQIMTDIVTTYPRRLIDSVQSATVVARALSLAGEIAEHDYTLEQAEKELRLFKSQLEEFGDSNATIRGGVDKVQERIDLLTVVDLYRQRKRAGGYIDFSDQLALATQIVRETPDVVAQLRSEYRAVLLDEFQDTSVIQMELLSAVFHDHPVTAVGDPNQAIYGWRGASAASLETFLDRFQPGIGHDEAQTLTLSTSWRNDERILKVSNLIAKPLRDAAANAKSPELNAPPGAGEGTVEIHYTADMRQQADAVAEFVGRNRGRMVRNGLPSTRTCAVLCRKRKHFALIDQVLREHEIPTQIIGLGGLLDQPEVEDVRAALELAVDVRNSPWVLRLLTNLDIGAADLRALAQWAERLAARGSGDAHPPALLAEAVDSPPQPGWRRNADSPAISAAAVERIRTLGRKLRAIRAGTGGGIVEQVERAMGILGVLDDVEADPLGGRGQDALNQFVDVAAGFEAETPNPDLRGFLTWLAVAEEEERGLAGPGSEPDPDAVQIMTVHGSKGLEWDAVAVVGLSETTFPSHGNRMKRDEIPVETTVDAWHSPDDKDGAWWGDSGSLPHPLRGDSSSLPPWEPDVDMGARSVAASFKKWFDGEYKPALGRHAVLEERRLAYVAFTRAREALLLAGSWVEDAKTPKRASRFLVEPLKAGVVEHADVHVSPMPSEEEIAEVLVAQTGRFPAAPGRSRALVTESAERVARRREVLRESGMEPEQALRALGGTVSGDAASRAVLGDAIAILAEERRRGEDARQVVSAPRISATRVPRLLDDLDGYVLDLRRPIPDQPSAAASMGTILHAWIERRLRTGASDGDGEPVPGEDLLDDDSRARLDAIRDRHFEELGQGAVPYLDMEPVALEEPFALTLGGISVQGRVDAVFRDAAGRTVIVDWKSGGAPKSAQARRQHATQLHLYRRAWSAQHGVPEDDIDAFIAYLADPVMVAVEDLAPDMDDRVLEAAIAAATTPGPSREDGPGGSTGSTRPRQPAKTD